MISGFQFLGHRIERLHLENIDNKKDMEELSLRYFANYRYRKKDGGWFGELELAFRRDLPNDDKTKCAYEIVILGSFEAPKDELIQTDEDFVKRLKVNGAATIIPIARAILTATASMICGSGLYTLPNINVFNLQWREGSSSME